MKSIIKYEMRHYIHSSVTFLFGGLFFMICAIYFFIDNIRGRSGDLTAFYSSVSVIMLFMLPVLTARVVSEDRKSGFEVILITSPISTVQMISGKFAATFIVIIIMLSSTLCFPAFLSLFADIDVVSLANRYLALLLLTASIAALGIFISSLTESQVAACVLSLISLLVLFAASPIGTAVGGNTAKIISAVSIFSRFTEMNQGMFTVGTVVYFISFTFVFLFLTVQTTAYRRIHGGGRS